MNLILNTGPTEEPLTLDEAKAHLRVEEDFTSDDIYIESLITAARTEAEKFSCYAFMPQTWSLYLDDWPSGPVYMPKPPLSSITEIKYTDEDDSENTLSTDVYFADTNRMPGLVDLKPNQVWPSVNLYPHGAIYIKFVAGYSDVDLVPANAIHAIKLAIAEMYEIREPVLLGQGANVAALPRGFESLLWDMRAQALVR